MRNPFRCLPTDTTRWRTLIIPMLVLGALLPRTILAAGELPATCADYCAPTALAAANSCLPLQSRAECLRDCTNSGGDLAELTGCFLAPVGDCGAIRFCKEQAKRAPARFWMYDRHTALMLGVIDSTTPSAVKRLLAEHPDLATIVLAYVPGSDDDDANFVAARMIRNAGLRTVVPIFGMVASGGTDFFLAGSERILKDAAAVGVHSWYDDDDNLQGRDYPRDHHEHQKYLEYYREMNIPEDFYWFTLDAASSNGMYYMSREEMAHFAIFTSP